MRRGAAAATLVAAWAVATLARADEPKVDIRDLPPLPVIEGEEDEGVAGVAVVASLRAEEDVVVGAAKREQSLGNVASAVTVIPGERLRRFGYRTVAEALRSVAGVYILDDRIVPRIGIRGMQLLGDFNTRILVLVDGASVNEPWNQYVGIGEDLPVTIDEVARIEVVRGPVSSVYGTNAFFGIINIVTRAADQSPRVWGRIGGGQFGTATGAAGFAVGNVNRQLRASASYGYRQGEVIDVAGLGEDIDADGMEWRTIAVAGTYDGLFAQARHFRRDRELPIAPYGGNAGEEGNTELDQIYLVEAGYTRDLGERVSVTARGYYADYRYEDYLIYEPDPDFRDIGISRWFGGEVRGFARVIPKVLGVTAGVEITDVHTESRAFEVGFEDEAIVVPKDFLVAGVYSEVELTPLSWFAASAGLRYDSNTAFTDKFSPRAALFFQKPERYGLKLLYAEGFRNPSAYEAFFDDDQTYTDNPGLGPETIRSYEAMLWGRPVAGVNARASVFRWEAADVISLTELPDGFLQHQNVESITSQGFEVEATYRDTAGWLGFASVTIADVTLGDETAPNAPLVVAQGGVSTPLILGFHASTELQLTSARRTRDAMLEADPFLGWNIVLHAPDVWRRVDVTIGLRNVLGRREEIPAQEDVDRPDGTPVYLIPGEGREVYARIGYRY